MGSKKKTYYYIMLASEFFADEIVSRLRAMDNGDSLALVYLHMLAYYVKTEGVIVIEVDTGESIAEQMHWQIQEDVVLIAKVLGVLEKYKRIVVENENVYVLKDIDKLIGQDNNYAMQKRGERERKKNNDNNGDNANDSVGNRGDKGNNNVGASVDNANNGNNSGPLADVVKNIKAKSEASHQKKMASARLAEIGVVGKVVDEIADWATVQQINDVYRSIDGAANINNKPGALVAALRANKAQLTAPRLKDITCPNCNGQGVVLDVDRDDGSMCTCPICNGSGQITQV
jgi:hypothetical protein